MKWWIVFVITALAGAYVTTLFAHHHNWIGYVISYTIALLVLVYSLLKATATQDD